MDSSQLLLALAPLIVLDLALIVFALRDLHRRPAAGVVGGSRWLWLAVILFVGTIGPVVYLWLGRVEPQVRDE